MTETHHPHRTAWAYVAGGGSDNVAVIDTASREVVGVVSVGDEPMLVALSPDGRTLLCTNRDGMSVSVIDTASLEVVATVEVQDGASGCGFSPQGDLAYVANEYSHTVSLIDTASWRAIDHVHVGHGPCALCVAAGGTVVVTNEESHNVAVLDGRTAQRKRHVMTPEGPLGLALAPDDTFALVACFMSNHLWCLDIPSWTVRWRAAIGGSHVGVCVTPDGERAVVTNSDADHVSVVDLSTRQEVARHTVGPNPASVALLPQDPNLAYVTIRGADSVSVLDLDMGELVSSISVGVSPLGICIGEGRSS